METLKCDQLAIQQTTIIIEKSYFPIFKLHDDYEIYTNNFSAGTQLAKKSFVRSQQPIIEALKESSLLMTLLIDAVLKM